MNKKNKIFKKKRIKWAIFVLCCLISVITVTTYAKTSGATVKKLADSKATKCTKEYVNSKYNPKVTSSNIDDEISVTVKLDSIENDIAFWYFLYDPANNKYVIENTAILETTKTFSFTRANKATEFISILVTTTKDSTYSQTSDNQCLRVEYARAKEMADYYAENLKFDGFGLTDGEHVIAFISEIEDASVEESSSTELNSSYNGICADFRNGNSSAFSSQSDTFKELFNEYNPKKVGDNDYKNKYLGYCYSEYVNIDYPKKEVLQMIENALTEKSIDSEIGGIVTSGSLTLGSSLSADTKKFNFSSVSQTVGDTDTLYCNKFATSNIQTYYVSASETTTYDSGNKCKKECEEVVTVEYGPPQATKAGLCFEYEVTVTSKVNCKTTYIGDKPQKSDYRVCKVKPSCNNSANYSDQAGPEEEFDGCISECDGGKYSQKCIDKCYKKIYENEMYTSNLSYQNKGEVTKLASYLSSASLNCTDANADALRAEILDSATCKYKYSGSSIIWNCPDSAKYWEKLGRYYFETKAKARQTLKSISTYSSGGHYLCTENRFGRHYRYYIDSKGFKRWCGNYTNSTSTECRRGCDEACVWYISTLGCNPKANEYYKNNKKGVINTRHDFLNKSDLEEDYAAALNNYKTEVKSCKAEAVCNTETSTFKIAVDNDYIDSDKNIKTNSPEFLANVSKVGNITGDVNVISKTDGTCYNKPESPLQASVTWSIPGTWINNKTGDISYEKPTSDGWTHKKNQFCTLLNSSNVNEAWWKWSVLGPITASDSEEVKTKKTEAKAAAEAETPKYNITASADNFGKFKFNIEVKCFYAISEPTPPPSGEPDPLNFRIRSVDSKDLFPSKDGNPTNTTTDSSATGRAPGFNWTDNAKSNKNANYTIDPVSLISKIQGSSDTYNSTNLDYEFVLDRASLNKIKKNDFTVFAGTFENTNGIYSYKSNIINNASNFKSSKINRKIGCNNSINSSTCE